MSAVERLRASTFSQATTREVLVFDRLLIKTRTLGRPLLSLQLEILAAAAIRQQNNEHKPRQMCINV